MSLLTPILPFLNSISLNLLFSFPLTDVRLLLSFFLSLQFCVFSVCLCVYMRAYLSQRSELTQGYRGGEEQLEIHSPLVPVPIN